MKQKSSLLIPIVIRIFAGLALQGSFILGLYFKPFTPQPIKIYQQQAHSIEATVTAYTNRPQETNHDPGNTATMETPVIGWTCAVSRDLIHWLGGRVYIEGIGVRRANDLMNARFEQSIDIYMGTVAEAREFGRQELTVIYLGR